MFDVSFSELMLIGVVALIVIGPERLPKVARTVGHLLGRAQRYVNDVKSDIRREMDADAFRDLKNQMDDAASTVRNSVNETRDALQNPLEEAQRTLNQFADDTTQTVRAAVPGAPVIEAPAESPATPAAQPASPPAADTPALAPETADSTAPGATTKPADGTQP